MSLTVIELSAMFVDRMTLRMPGCGRSKTLRCSTAVTLECSGSTHRRCASATLSPVDGSM